MPATETDLPDLHDEWIEGLVVGFPTPDELWNKIFGSQDEWRDKFNQVPFELAGEVQSIRYYQELAVNR
jgi:type I restriction enzyme R subunit